MATPHHMSSIYAMASGITAVPAAREQQAAGLNSATAALYCWLPKEVGKFDRPVPLTANDALPGLMSALFERNKRDAATQQVAKLANDLEDEEFFVRRRSTPGSRACKGPPALRGGKY